MGDPLTYLMIYTGFEPRDVAAAAALIPILLALFGMLVIIYSDMTRDKAIRRYGSAAVYHASPNHNINISYAQIALGSAVFLIGLYIAGWYCNHVPDNTIQYWIDVVWKPVY